MATKACSTCHSTLPLDNFGTRTRNSNGYKKGELTAVCLACAEKAKERRKAKEQKRAIVGEEEAEQLEAAEDDLDVMSLTDFVNAVKGMDAPVDISARVEVTCALGPAAAEGTDRERADRIAEVIGAFTELHWT